METPIYRRIKTEGTWRYSKTNTGKGAVAVEDRENPPYFLRHATPDGKRTWVRITDAKGQDVATLAEAKAQAPIAAAGLLADAKGITVADLATAGNRKTVREAVDTFLALRKTNPRRTVLVYSRSLGLFTDFTKGRVKFIDGLTSEALADLLGAYKLFLEAEGFAPRSVKNHIVNACTLLKKNGYQNSSKLAVMPTVDKKPVDAYTPEELETFFKYLTDEAKTGDAKAAENLEQYRFFLGSSLREQEVQFLAWTDINFKNLSVRVQPKLDVGFTVKNHEVRNVPISSDLIAMLQNRRDTAAGKNRWVFPTEHGEPEGHFLRKLKAIAKDAGLNCGTCKTTVLKGDYDTKHEVSVTCKHDAVCKNWTLHRFRKTRAQRWLENGVLLTKIQKWLGHKSLATTEIYLGSGEFEESDRAKVDAA